MSVRVRVALCVRWSGFCGASKCNLVSSRVSHCIDTDAREVVQTDPLRRRGQWTRREEDENSGGMRDAASCMVDCGVSEWRGQKFAAGETVHASVASDLH